MLGSKQCKAGLNAVWCHAVQCKKVLYSKQCKTQLIAALSAVLVASIQCKTQLIAALRAVLVVVQFSEQ